MRPFTFLDCEMTLAEPFLWPADRCRFSQDLDPISRHRPRRRTLKTLTFGVIGRPTIFLSNAVARDRGLAGPAKWYNHRSRRAIPAHHHLT